MPLIVTFPDVRLRLDVSDVEESLLFNRDSSPPYTRRNLPSSPRKKSVLHPTHISKV